ncbi:hypothetical protein D9619_002509 [Psilocybe cf. subviscida]|uniref:Uncharacterized protein n=1 Tax=Psilocybe cf. subviscida TaxID=2480587 RepID=A0A8H5AWJ4_9AGAR|nr:hypothetical protein D9619_002509 [Psilocybe cf. subviscida]
MKPDPGTYGAMILGVLAASVLSGVFAVQCLIYFRFYPQDRKELKALVMLLAQPTEDLNHSLWAIFRTLEIAHTVLIWVAIWDYFVTNFGNPVYIDHIPPLNHSFKRCVDGHTHLPYTLSIGSSNISLELPKPPTCNPNPISGNTSPRYEAMNERLPNVFKN